MSDYDRQVLERRARIRARQRRSNFGLGVKVGLAGFGVFVAYLVVLGVAVGLIAAVAVWTLRWLGVL